MRRPVACFLALLGLAAAQYRQPYATSTPVPILKQINKHNEDGSYSYGYEAADGTYKIESKYPSGEVYGKYGFLDDTGNLREVEYGASRRGFEPVGPGINVAPPTLTGNSIADPPVGTRGMKEPEDDGQYREDPSVYYTDPRYTNGERYEPVAPPQRMFHPMTRVYDDGPRLNPVPRYPTSIGYQSTPRHEVPAVAYRPQYQSNYQPQYQGQQRSLYAPSPIQPGYQQRRGQPNVDPNAGLASYTVSYRR